MVGLTLAYFILEWVALHGGLGGIGTHGIFDMSLWLWRFELMFCFLGFIIEIIIIVGVLVLSDFTLGRFVTISIRLRVLTSSIEWWISWQFPPYQSHHLNSPT